MVFSFIFQIFKGYRTNKDNVLYIFHEAYLNVGFLVIFFSYLRSVLCMYAFMYTIYMQYILNTIFVIQIMGSCFGLKRHRNCINIIIVQIIGKNGCLGQHESQVLDFVVGFCGCIQLISFDVWLVQIHIKFICVTHDWEVIILLIHVSLISSYLIFQSLKGVAFYLNQALFLFLVLLIVSRHVSIQMLVGKIFVDIPKLVYIRKSYKSCLFHHLLNGILVSVKKGILVSVRELYYMVLKYLTNSLRIDRQGRGYAHKVSFRIHLYLYLIYIFIFFVFLGFEESDVVQQVRRGGNRKRFQRELIVNQKLSSFLTQLGRIVGYYC
eukprot:TRINITY_DN6938_c1_g2_i2.p1 TRINITY_DN6938_c1_g2~~TRINITY_DN6938_c1_g2_i2.p1  ORF type:complete len:323 (+),score=-18.93 TRINITY_DN6938_c1_g2_i2:134-1102(+)